MEPESSTPQMIHRQIPSTGEMIPVIGLGSWQQFDVEAKSPECSSLLAVLDAMHKSGAKVIDSSPMYGKAEEMIGLLTEESGKADSFFYATKVWTTGRQKGIEQLANSFSLMKRRTMDLVQIHNMLDIATQLPLITEYKKLGKIRYTGITHYTVSSHDELERHVRSQVFDFVQFNYSIVNRHAERSLLKAAEDYGKAIIINEPFEKGELFKAVHKMSLPAWALELSISSWAEFFLKYIVSHPAVTCVIPGTSVPAHITQCLQAGLEPLPDENSRRKMARFMQDL